MNANSCADGLECGSLTPLSRGTTLKTVAVTTQEALRFGRFAQLVQSGAV
ncbi:MAG: hypothetical protein QGH29_02450 [Kiritimatiellia bacterium]|nr:hypothetical protein [Kiritimatiellia bacterium]